MIDDKEIIETPNPGFEAPEELPKVPEMVENQGENAPDMVENQDKEVEAAPVVVSEPERISSKHFKRVNQEKEQLRRERDELLQRMQQQQQYYQPNGPQQAQPLQDNFNNIDENNFAEGKDLKRVAQELQNVRNELQQYKQKSVMEVTEARLHAEFKDFSDVFSDDNIELFKAEHPDIAESLAHSSADPYKVAKSMYKAIKQFGIYEETPTKQIVKDRERVQNNLSKPRPVSSVTARQGNSPLSRAGEYADDELTPERKAALRAEVERYSR